MPVVVYRSPHRMILDREKAAEARLRGPKPISQVGGGQGGMLTSFTGAQSGGK